MKFIMVWTLIIEGFSLNPNVMWQFRPPFIFEDLESNEDCHNKAKEQVNKLSEFLPTEYQKSPMDYVCVGRSKPEG